MTPSDVPYNPAGETPAVWAIPISLAATDGIDFSFSSSGYLDVSVHQVVTALPMDSAGSSRVPRDHRLFVNSPRIFADFHALLLSTPRHPPCALRNLAIEIPNSIPNRTARCSEPNDQTPSPRCRGKLPTISHETPPKLTQTKVQINRRWRTESSTESSYQLTDTPPRGHPRKPGHRSEQGTATGNAP